ncbi:hypothetical protein VRK_39920 [Vibrio sp. MEBiC08052]|nr:hypothetical protein VRK_39920 [Vibrio sp. MEBiC08052]
MTILRKYKEEEEGKIHRVGFPLFLLSVLSPNQFINGGMWSG